GRRGRAPAHNRLGAPRVACGGEAAPPRCVRHVERPVAARRRTSNRGVALRIALAQDSGEPHVPRAAVASIQRRSDRVALEAVGRVADSELVNLHRRAACFLDPTLYEGFGYGVLEAMASGTPVVASSTTSIPEVVGDAGLLCDPRDIGALALAVGRVLDEPGL